jgi:hypothetical protein
MNLNLNQNTIVANFARNLEKVNNTIKTNVANIAANVNKTFNNSFEANNASPMGSVSHTIYIWILVIAVSIGVIYLIKRFLIDENPALIQSWIDMFRSEQRSGAAGAMPPPLVPPSAALPAAVHPDTESWCFVGEDLTGRYCVKVPSAKSCDAGRTYRSRQDCEMVPAQHLPAGVVTKQGAGMLPLLSGK